MLQKITNYNYTTVKLLTAQTENKEWKNNG